MSRVMDADAKDIFRLPEEDTRPAGTDWNRLNILLFYIK
jgi:hypothetical protein